MGEQKNIWRKILVIFLAGVIIGAGTLYFVTRSAAADARATITRITDELNASRRDTELALATVASLNISNTKLEGSLRIAKDAGTASENRARELQKNLRSTEQELQRVNDIVKRLEASNYELRNQITELGRAAEELWKRFTELEASAGADAERIGSLEAQLSEYIDYASNLQIRIGEYLQQIESIGGDISELGDISSQFDATVADLARLSQEIAGTSGDLDSILTAIERFVDEGIRGIENLEGINNKLNTTIERLRGQLKPNS